VLYNERYRRVAQTDRTKNAGIAARRSKTDVRSKKMIATLGTSAIIARAAQTRPCVHKTCHIPWPRAYFLRSRPVNIQASRTASHTRIARILAAAVLTLGKTQALISGFHIAVTSTKLWILKDNCVRRHNMTIAISLLSLFHIAMTRSPIRDEAKVTVT